MLGVLALAGACAPTPVAPAAVTAAAPSVIAAPTPPAPPAAIVAGAIPGDVDLYAEITRVPEIVAELRGVVGPALVAETRAALGKELGIDAALAERLVDSVSSIHLGGKRAGSDFKAAISIVLADAAPLREVIAAGALGETGAYGPHGRRLKGKGAKDVMVWFEAVKLLVIGDEPIAQGVAAVVEGRAPGRSATAGAGPGPRATAVVATAALDDLVKGQVSFAAPLTAAYDGWEGGIRGALRTAIAARDLDRNLPLPSPRALALARRLPRETAAYVALSTGLPGGRDGAARLLQQIVALGGSEADRGLADLESGLALAGVKLVDVLGSLGDEAVLGGVVRAGAKTQKDLDSGYAVVFLQELSDPKVAEQMIKSLRDKLVSAPKKRVKVRPEGAGFSAEISGGPPSFARVKLDKNKLFVAVGARDLCDRASAAVDKGKGTLGEDGAHARAVSALPARSALRLWIDLARAADLSGALSRKPAFEAQELWSRVGKGDQRLTSALAFTAVPEADRVRLELDEVNGIGLFAAVGIFGVRSYLSAAKSAEAKNTLGALTRAAVAAHEREHLGPNNTAIHKLCQSAPPVPATVPRGVKYQPSLKAGSDYDTGDALTGWRCLKFTMSVPQYYQYTYSAGGPYKGPRRGGPDPGPNGFEVAAEGDLDGDGVTSLFTRTGTISPHSGLVTISTELWSDQEKE